MSRTVGFYPGTFDPVHNGHLLVARRVIESRLVDEVWMSPSPINPLKQGVQVPSPYDDRLEWLRIATDGFDRVTTTDIERDLPLPSYTIDTLRELSRRHPGLRFRLITGADNLELIERWKDWQSILRDYGMIVYARPGHSLNPRPGVVVLEGELSDASSTSIRADIAAGRVPAGLPHSLATSPSLLQRFR